MPNSKFVPFKKKHPVAPSQDKVEGRMPKTVGSKLSGSKADPATGDGNVRSVDPGDGLVRGTDMPKKV